MRVNVDKKVCIGSGTCIEVCPEIFRLVDGKSLVQTDLVPKDKEELFGMP
jgi:ferredoxin